jgi:outer membrane immunogenic protein
MISRAYGGGVTLAAGTLALTAAFTAFAHAADLPPAPRMPSPVAPVAYAPPLYNWSGFYIGGNVGGGFSNSSWTDPAGGTDTFNNSGFLGGAQIGVNAQFNWLVVGLEGDFDWTNIKATGTDSLGEGLTSNPEWTSTVTGRIGAAFDRVLIYGKGGVAFAHDINTLTNAAGSSTDALNRTGWTAGAGLEYAISQNWTARVEYDYLGFGSQTLNFANTAATPSASLNVQEVKAGFNYKFGP